MSWKIFIDSPLVWIFKSNVLVAAPFGGLPYMTVNGKAIGQSIAMCRYAGRKAGLAGSSLEEAAQMDAIVDTVDEVRVKPWNYFFGLRDSAEKVRLHVRCCNKALLQVHEEFHSIFREQDSRKKWMRNFRRCLINSNRELLRIRKDRSSSETRLFT